MKKLLAMILLVAILLPCVNVEAKSAKVENPTVSLTYNTNNSKWYVSFGHTNSKAKIYFANASGTTKYKEVKQNKKIAVEYTSRFYVKAKVGNTYSTKKKYLVKDLMIAKTDKDVKALAKKIVGKASTDFSKFVLISKYCSKNWEYGDSKARTTENARYTYMHIIYDNKGVCADMAYAYQKMLNAVGIKAVYITDDTSSKYGYEYLDDHAWTHVKIDGQWQLIDITNASNDLFDCLQVDIYNSYNKIAESNTLGLDNLRLYIKTEKWVLPICDFLQDSDDAIMTWSDNKITNVFEDGAYIVDLIYNKDLGYWEMFTTEDGVTTKD